MKKLICALLFIIGFATIAYALPPCPDSAPCIPEMPWEEPPETQLVSLPGVVCPGCQIEIKWWHRKCGNGIQIKMGSVSVPTMSGDCSACMDMIPSFAARWVLKHDPYITENFIGWQPGQTICVENIKLSRFSCYRWIPGKDGESGPTPDLSWSHMEQCMPDITGCCAYTVEVCKTWEGTVNDAEYLTSQPVDCGNGCINNCTFNDGEIWLKQGVTSPEKKECNLAETFEITPNPTDGNAHIKMAVKEKGVYTLMITDLRGNPVFESSLKLSGTSYENDINLAGISSGPYLYKVTLGNRTCFNGKVNIVK